MPMAASGIVPVPRLATGQDLLLRAAVTGVAQFLECGCIRVTGFMASRQLICSETNRFVTSFNSAVEDG